MKKDQRAVRYLGYKYIETTEPGGSSEVSPPLSPVQLYDLRADPGERVNRAEEMPELASRMSEWLAAREGERSDGELRPSVDELPGTLRERLRSLGYVD